MNPLMGELHDIDGLDQIGLWPLAAGWWVLIALGIVILCALAVFTGYKIAFMRSWKNDTIKKLAGLEDNLSEATARESVMTLSEYLRRIALKRFSRKECAGLMGESWLKWLKEHDPKEFDWVAKGSLLIEAPYAPVHSSLPVSQIKDLIQATREWVR